jgi:putrescine transport system substrate-binding protein
MRFKTSRVITQLAAMATLAVSSAAFAQTEPPVLNIYNWSDYIGLDTIKNFEKETGIKVRYDTFDNNEILHAKLVAGKTGYDIVVPSSNWAKIQIDGGLLRKLDRSQLSNYGNLDKGIMASVSKLDGGNAHLVPWLWGITTVGINVDKVKAALGDLPMPSNAYDLVFDPKYMSRLKSCGVSFLDSASEIIPTAMHYLGKNAYSKSIQDYSGVGPMLAKVRPYVSLFSSSGYINDLAGGSICVALGWSGDINIAKNRAIEARNGQKIEALLPATGAVPFFDVMAIPTDASHPGNAHKFINYILKGEVQAQITNKVFYPGPNEAAKKFIKPEVANDTTIFLTDDYKKKLVTIDAVNNDIRRSITRMFTAFKTGL